MLDPLGHNHKPRRRLSSPACLLALIRAVRSSSDRGGEEEEKKTVRQPCGNSFSLSPPGPAASGVPEALPDSGGKVYPGSDVKLGHTVTGREGGGGGVKKTPAAAALESKCPPPAQFFLFPPSSITPWSRLKGLPTQKKRHTHTQSREEGGLATQLSGTAATGRIPAFLSSCITASTHTLPADAPIEHGEQEVEEENKIKNTPEGWGGGGGSHAKHAKFSGNRREEKKKPAGRTAEEMSRAVGIPRFL